MRNRIEVFMEMSMLSMIKKFELYKTQNFRYFRLNIQFLAKDEL